MKKLVSLAFTLILFSFHSLSAQENTNNCLTAPLSWSDLSSEERKEAFHYMITTGGCEYKGIELHGKVQFVTSFPDIKIQYVTSFPDIKVKFVSSFPDDCGEWQVVESFPDFKVQIVESFPDLKVQMVDSFPGMN